MKLQVDCLYNLMMIGGNANTCGMMVTIKVESQVMVMESYVVDINTINQNPSSSSFKNTK